MIVETDPGTRLLEIPDDGRVKMQDFRQLTEGHPGAWGRIARGLGVGVNVLWREIAAGTLLARYEDGKLVLELDR